MTFTPAQVSIANATSRSRGAVGGKAMVPAYIERTATKDETILDFGAGKDATHARYLNSLGFKVTAYDFGANDRSDFHVKSALSSTYDTVYASNVLNVQTDVDMLVATLEQIKAVAIKRVVFNYPSEPRKAGLPVAIVAFKVADVFGINPELVGGTRAAPLWELTIEG